MRYIILFFLGVSVIACNDDDSSSAGCNGDLVCTEEFRTVVIDILAADGSPASLDEVSVTNLDTDESLTFQWDLTPGYAIADDSMLETVDMDGHRIELVGSIAGEEVVRQTFLVGHDCCHVILLEGPTTIQLN